MDTPYFFLEQKHRFHIFWNLKNRFLFFRESARFPSFQKVSQGFFSIIVSSLKTSNNAIVVTGHLWLHWSLLQWQANQPSAELFLSRGFLILWPFATWEISLNNWVFKTIWVQKTWWSLENHGAEASLKWWIEGLVLCDIWVRMGQTYGKGTIDWDCSYGGV